MVSLSELSFIGLILHIKFTSLSSSELDCSPTETEIFYESGEDISSWILSNPAAMGYIMTQDNEDICYLTPCISLWSFISVELSMLSPYISTSCCNNINIKYSVYPQISEGDDTCLVSYTVDHQVSFTEISGTNFLDVDLMHNISESLGTDASDTEYLQIILKNIPAQGGQYCNFDEIKICGTSLYATDSPTSNTTQPTGTPTAHPITTSPTSVTGQPTLPTTAQPSDATAQPTTMSPTWHPTVTSNAPTKDTASPSGSPTAAELVTTQFDVIVTEEESSVVVEDTKAKQPSLEVITACIAGVLGTGIAVTAIDGKALRPNDYFKIGALVKSSLQILDFVSDVFFMVTIANHPDLLSRWYLLVLCVLSVIFIVVPVSISIFQLQAIIKKHWSQNDEIKTWLQNHMYHLFMLSLFCGNSFSALNVCTSNAFDLRLFCMPLSRMDKAHFQYRRVYSVVLLENLPQFLIAVCYASIVGGSDAIVYVSMAFSALSILMMVAAMQTLKQLIKTQDHSIISMNVIGSVTADNIRFCQRKTNKIRNHMSVLLGVDKNLIEIPKPQQIHQGLQLNVILLINNVTSGNLDVEGKISDTETNQGIAECIKENWDLNALPQISLNNYEQKQSKKRATELANVEEGKQLKTDVTHSVEEHASGDDR